MHEGPGADISELLQHGYRYALSLTHNRANAEDVLQDAWLALLTANGPRSQRYLFSAIRSRFINLYKREQLVSIVSIDSQDTPEVEAAAPENDAPFEYEHVETALSTLRSLEREALFLTVVEGYTAQEVANFTGQPRGTVLSLIHRAKQKVRLHVSKKNVEVLP